MLSQRSWRHHRLVEPTGPGRCTVTDDVSFQPRLPVPGRVLEAIFRQVFAHRHRRLRRRFGTRLMRITDARGLNCPMPLVMAKTAMETVPAGEELVVLATDPEAAIDLAAWALDQGYELTERAAEGWTEYRAAQQLARVARARAAARRGRPPQRLHGLVQRRRHGGHVGQRPPGRRTGRSAGGRGSRRSPTDSAWSSASGTTG